MTCANCGYHWREDNEDYPCCHYEGPDAWAPCAYEDAYEDESYGE